ncbi:MAG: hypothetical protein KAS66_03590 [Candidatus Omnitrophica bacterium]|nr:hypothetical protein [Candidatus Omnitrophota bacterium]
MDPVELIKEMSIAQNKLEESEVILTGLLHKEGLSEKYIGGGLSYYRLNLSRFEKYLNNPQLAVGPILNNIKNSRRPVQPGTDEKYSGDIDEQIKTLRKKWSDNGVSTKLIKKGLKMLDNWIDTFNNAIYKNEK